MNQSFLGKLLERLDKLSPEDLQAHLIRLAKEKGFLETIFDTLQEGIIILDTRGIIEYVNRGASKLISIPEELPTNTPISRYLKGIPWETLLEQHDATTRTLEVNYPEHRVLQLNLLPMKWGPEDASRRIAIFHDITQQQDATRKALESERLETLTLLAAGVAHELGNPLNNLHIHLQLMQREVRELPPESSEHLKDSITIAQREIDRLDHIINQFLRAIRPTDPDRNLTNLSRLIEETVELLRFELDDRDILLELELPSAFPDLMLDSEQMKQAIYNVLKNALQALNQGGILRISGEVTTESLILSFVDNGPGIPQENLPHIMDPYFTTKAKGSGLGLMIVQRIIREHGGLLEINSRANQGTTVRIILPLLQKRVQMLPPSESSK